MPVLSFSVETGRGPLYLLIQTDQKNQTIRKPRKRPWVIGDDLYLYWKQRTSPDKKMIHMIGTATLKSCTRMRAEDIWNDPDMAVKDGFVDMMEMFQWFRAGGAEPDDEYDVLVWEGFEHGVEASEGQ